MIPAKLVLQCFHMTVLLADISTFFDLWIYWLLITAGVLHLFNFILFLSAVFFSVLVVVVKSSLTRCQAVMSEQCLYQAAHLALQSSSKCCFNFQVDRRQRLILQAEEESNNDKSPPQKTDPDSPGKLLLLLPGLLIS